MLKKRILAIFLCLVMLTSLLTACAQKSPDAPPASKPEDPPATEQGNTPSTPTVVVPDFNALNKRDEVMAPLQNDYLSRTHTSYANINGNDVDVYTFFRNLNEAPNNPNFSQALMLYQCIKYKDAHPEEEVTISIASFHISVVASACLDKNSAEYGLMKNLYDEEYTTDGYYRISYLCVEAARKGINITVIGQLDADSTIREDGNWLPDLSFEQYFNDHLEEDTYITGKKVKDYMTFRRSYWTSYGDKSAADMMHLKACAVSHYIDNDGVEHGEAVWLGSTNIDGIHGSGVNGNDSIQTAVIITGHAELYRVLVNYMRLMTDYCDQQDVVPFREKVSGLSTEQVALLKAGRDAEIPADKQIVYIGTETDSVFELYFTPLGGNSGMWDTDNNPYCKYLTEMLNADAGEYLELLWNNPKYLQTFEFADVLAQHLVQIFKENESLENNLYLQLPGIDETMFNSLIPGHNVGTKIINAQASWIYHIKDLQLSYSKDGERQWVTVYNTLNIHEGSMSYQANSLLIIHETEKTGNNFYTDYAIMTTPGIDFECHRVK